MVEERVEDEPWGCIPFGLVRRKIRHVKAIEMKFIRILCRPPNKYLCTNCEEKWKLMMTFFCTEDWGNHFIVLFIVIFIDVWKVVVPIPSSTHFPNQLYLSFTSELSFSIQISAYRMKIKIFRLNMLCTGWVSWELFCRLLRDGKVFT